MAGRERLPLRRLRSFDPLNRLTADQLVLLVNRAERRCHSPGQTVIEQGARDGLDFFLVSGAVELHAKDGRKSVIEAETEQARNPIARLQPRMYEVVAVRPSEFLVVEQDILNDFLNSAPVSQVEMDPSGEWVASDSVEHRLRMEFNSELRSNHIRLPSVPDMAWKVRRTAAREGLSGKKLARAITADPAMVGKLLRACSSPLYREPGAVRSVHEAVDRLGPGTTRQLVSEFALREVFRSRQMSLQREMVKACQQSREVAALSWLIASQIGGVDPDEAELAGLLHNIGVVPLLVLAEHHPGLWSSEASLRSVAGSLRPEFGAALLESWACPRDLLEAVSHAGDWHYESPETGPQLVDVVITARLHSMISSSQNGELSAPNQVPAVWRLGGPEPGASRSQELLAEARARVGQTEQLLSTR
ncbi:HDOD domain-containing protein [Marinobacter pelagius]|uniref:HDOD domain-containing protein n=1 Tax=Marinobacter sp. C7 TaxID=2951363 RepID=UPI001EF0CCAE|nr:HDOD domain-containing protein [Marinobacter sp. C7]MCG7201005.1 HDOD domain-containing protein [Marinobacter sp. C7]